MYCTKCGKEIVDDAVVCINCGCLVESKRVNKELNAQNNDKSVFSYVFGITGIVFAWLFALIGHILSVLGIVFGIKEYRENGKTAGLILSIIGEVCSVISSIIGIVVFIGYI